MRLEERSCNRKRIDIRAVQEILTFLERPEFLTLFVLYLTCRGWAGGLDATKVKLLLVLLLLSSCATLSKEEKAMKLAEVKDEYEMRAAACHRGGGHMVVERKLTLKYTILDYKGAYCAKF